MMIDPREIPGTEYVPKQRSWTTEWKYGANDIQYSVANYEEYIKYLYSVYKDVYKVFSYSQDRSDWEYYKSKYEFVKLTLGLDK